MGRSERNGGGGKKKTVGQEKQVMGAPRNLKNKKRATKIREKGRKTSITQKRDLEKQRHSRMGREKAKPNKEKPRLCTNQNEEEDNWQKQGKGVIGKGQKTATRGEKFVGSCKAGTLGIKDVQGCHTAEPRLSLDEENGAQKKGEQMKRANIRSQGKTGKPERKQIRLPKREKKRGRGDVGKYWVKNSLGQKKGGGFHTKTRKEGNGKNENTRKNALGG